MTEEIGRNKRSIERPGGGFNISDEEALRDSDDIFIDIESDYSVVISYRNKLGKLQKTIKKFDSDDAAKNWVQRATSKLTKYKKYM